MSFNVKKGTITIDATGNKTLSLPSDFDPKAIMLWGSTRAAVGTSAASDRNSFGVGFGSYRGAAVQHTTKSIQSDSTDPASSAGARLSASNHLFQTCNASGVMDAEIDLVSMQGGATSEVVINVVALDTLANVIIHYLILGGSDITDALVHNATTSTTSPQDISVVGGFGHPDLVGIIGSKAAGAATTDPQISIGWGIKDGAQCVHHWVSDDSGSVALAAYQRLDRIYSSSIIPLGSAVDADASLAASSGWPTDGFELTWNDTAPNATDHLGCLLLKGTFSKALGQLSQPTSGGLPVTQDQALSFTPKCVLTHTLSIPAAITYNTSHADLGSVQMGASDGTDEGSSLYLDGDAEATQRVRHRLSTTKVIEMASQASTTTTLVADADAIFQTNNLRFSWTTINATARGFLYLALGDAPIPHVRKSLKLIRSDAVQRASRW